MDSNAWLISLSIIGMLGLIVVVTLYRNANTMRRRRYQHNSRHHVQVRPSREPINTSRPNDQRIVLGSVQIMPEPIQVNQRPAAIHIGSLQPAPAHSIHVGDVSDQARLCPVCRSVLVVGIVIIECDRCNITRHLECWQEDIQQPIRPCSQCHSPVTQKLFR